MPAVITLESTGSSVSIQTLPLASGPATAEEIADGDWALWAYRAMPTDILVPDDAA
jgi:hypothetical protein